MKTWSGVMRRAAHQLWGTWCLCSQYSHAERIIVVGYVLCLSERLIGMLADREIVHVAEPQTLVTRVTARHSLNCTRACTEPLFDKTRGRDVDARRLEAKGVTQSTSHWQELLPLTPIAPRCWVNTADHSQFETISLFHISPSIRSATTVSLPQSPPVL